MSPSSAHDASIVQVTKFINVSPMALYIYNFFLVYNDELKYMWKAEFGLGKVVYFVIRYLTLLVIVLTNTGLAWMRFHCIASVAIALLTEIPLVLRIYALYNKDKRVLALLVSCLAATTISVIGISAKLMHSEHSTMVHFEFTSNLNVCILTKASRIYKFFWVPLLLNEALLVSLALIKWFENIKVHGVQESAMGDMMKDSVLYFFATFPFLLFIQLTWTFGGALFLELPVGFAVVMGSIMSQRLLVNVRKYQFGHPFDVLRTLKGQSIRGTRRFTVAGCIVAAGNFN